MKTYADGILLKKLLAFYLGKKGKNRFFSLFSILAVLLIKNCRFSRSD
jgi:hypothetical protein